MHFDDLVAFDSLNKTLNLMAQGGIYDHIGGGFHRYSTDHHWLVPHFEKMLYNQANLSRIYMRACEITGIEFYKQVVTETLDYVIREMTDQKGGFYSATDADNEDREGTFFIWKQSELKTILTEQEYKLTVELYGITETGNFEGENIFYLPQAYTDYASSHKIELNNLLKSVKNLKQKLWNVRNKRTPLLRDDKIITAWNGMMIIAFSEAGKALGRNDYTQTAINAANYLLDKNRQEDGLLWRASLNGRPSTAGKQEDYASLTEALTELYDSTNEKRWLDEAQKITTIMLEKFWDKQGGGFFMNTEESIVKLPTRPKELGDNAVPSGNSIAFRVMAKLAKRTGNEDYKNQLEEMIVGLSAKINQYPELYPYMQTGLLEFLNYEYKAKQFAVGVNVNIESRISNKNQDIELTIIVNMKPEWHINSNKPLSNNLVPIKLSANENSPWEIIELTYPEPSIKSLSFSTEKLALYENTIVIKGKLIRKTVDDYELLKLIKLKLRIQACNNNTCLTPETVSIVLPS